MIIEQLYDALLEAGASETKAREASRAVADFQGAVHELKLDNEKIRSTQTLHSWMLGIIIGIGVALLLKAYVH